MKITEENFDSLLTAALYKAAELDYGDIPTDDEIERIIEPSLQFQDKMKILLRNKNTSRSKYRSTIIKFMQSAAAVLIICTVLLGTLMLASPTARAAVFDFVRSWFEDRIEYFTPDSNYDFNKKWSFEYIPDGFELLDAFETELQLFYVYQNVENTLLMISISDGRQIIDNEHSEISHAILENGNFVDIYESNDPVYPNNIIMFDETSRVIITIISELPINELLMIAENIK
ncbi:MAG: DUF4367 domain-containing protein [Oscillospiraceae bacterium]|jgi:hypothetical protein|nr:DUF4367 domain-containing protein [Oscillospiraceae bacterium]